MSPLVSFVQKFVQKFIQKVRPRVENAMTLSQSIRQIPIALDYFNTLITLPFRPHCILLRLLFLHYCLL